VGILRDDTLSFDGGSSSATMEPMAAGRLRHVEMFKWESKDGGGENILEEASESQPNQSTEPASAVRTEYLTGAG
jgi:hypothetical protein